MAILETLYILFKSDASEVKKGADEAEKSTKHLEQSLKNVGKESDHIGASFSAAARSVVGLFAGIASISAVIQGFHSAINEVTEIGNLSRELNVNVEALNAWQNAVQRTGGTASGFNSSLSGLASHFGTTPQIALQLLPQLASVFSRFNQYQANTYGKSLGLDQSTIYLLQQGRREVEATIKQQQRLGLITKEQVDITRKFDNALYDSGRAYKTFYRELTVPLLPYLTKALNYFIEHEDAIKGAMLGIGAAALIMGARFAIAFPYISAVTGAIAALGVAYEDVKGFIKGDKETALGLAFGVGKGGLPDLKKKNTEKLSHAPEWVQKLIGLKVPNYASNRLLNNNTQVHVDNITINTQATNAQQIAIDFSKSISDQLFQTNSHFDNGGYGIMAIIPDILANLLPSFAIDYVGVFDQNYNQLFKQARAIKAIVKETAKLMEHPVESGIIITDHRIILPVEIELSLILTSQTYQDVYKSIRQFYLNGTLLVVQTRSDIYDNQIIESMPTRRDPTQYDVLTVDLNLKQVQFVTAQYGIVPKNNSNNNTQKRGTQQGNEANTRQTTIAYDAIHSLSK